MAEKCVKIEVDEQGQVTVGLEPPEAEQQTSPGQHEEGAEQSYMKPVQNIDQALQVAKDLLTSPQAQQAQAGPDAGAQMAQGFKQGMRQRKYPMPDKSHAANAKARASQQEARGNLSAAEKARIDAKANRILGR